jgi:hypothetical protein
MRCNICASVHVGMGFAWGKLGFTSVWAYVGPLERQAQHKTKHKQNTRTARENKSKIIVDKIKTCAIIGPSINYIGVCLYVYYIQRI